METVYMRYVGPGTISKKPIVFMIKIDSMLETCNVFPVRIMILGLLYNLGLSETTNKGSAP